MLISLFVPAISCMFCLSFNGNVFEKKVKLVFKGCGDLYNAFFNINYGLLKSQQVPFASPGSRKLFTKPRNDHVT